MFDAITQYGITRKSINNKLIKITIWNPRDFTKHKNKNIDCRPYGGGSGMLMTAEPIFLAIKKAQLTLKTKTQVVYLSPQGKKLNNKIILELSKNKALILLCGRYEGIDERLMHSSIIDEEISIGDYVLSGGELPAMVLIDAICRIIPGSVNKLQSIQNDSFYNGLLDYPQYTRPRIFNNIKIPKILLSGHHKNIKTWRLQQSLGQTWIKRPDLLRHKTLTDQEKILLDKFKKNTNYLVKNTYLKK